MTIGLKGPAIIVAIIVIVGIVAFVVINNIYNKNLDKIYSELDQVGQAESVIDNSGVEITSSGVGKTASELEEEAKIVSAENEEELEVSVSQDDTGEEKVISAEDTPAQVIVEQKEETKVEEPTPDPVFMLPVEGEVIKEYAEDKLVYSETLKEWTQHTGVDIKAEKTTIVKAAESGTVTAIKNDPRYGITVTIAHSNGYETRYANLLTAEFVSVGEEVTKGQTIGTVGNTATFEILDDSHLHFEILKDGKALDPILFVEI